MDHLKFLYMMSVSIIIIVPLISTSVFGFVFFFSTWNPLPFPVWMSNRPLNPLTPPPLHRAHLITSPKPIGAPSRAETRRPITHRRRGQTCESSRYGWIYTMGIYTAAFWYCLVTAALFNNRSANTDVADQRHAMFLFCCFFTFAQDANVQG